jgi:hypothetical protein
MSKLFFIDCLALIKIWATGFFGFHISGLIHVLPIIAVFALLLGVFNKRSLIQ